MTWSNPIPLVLVRDPDPVGFRHHPNGVTGLPIGDQHPGAFGFERANHVHEGIDLYCPDGTPVSAVEGGYVVAVIHFTGRRAEPPSPWWHDTRAVLIRGESGVVLYGEIEPDPMVVLGARIARGELIGRVRQVLIKDKTPPRPKAMLHLELHLPGTRDAFEWTREGGRPASLLDPTPLLEAMIDAPAAVPVTIEDVSEVFDALDAAASAGEALDAIPETWSVFMTGPDATGRFAFGTRPAGVTGVVERIHARGLANGTGATRLEAVRAGVARLREAMPRRG